MYSPIPSKISADEKLEVKFLGTIEPNNGRMLWKVEVFFQNKNINNLIFGENWNVFNFELDKWVIEDEKNRFYYLPIEGISILIDTKTLKIHYLPNQPLSTIYFKGNIFEDDFLIEKYDDIIVKTDLQTFISEESKV